MMLSRIQTYLFLFFICTPIYAGEKLALFDMHGTEHKLVEQQGKWVVINYWATWCPPCVKEIPELEKFHNTYKKKNAIVWGVNFENIEENLLQKFLTRFNVSYPILLAEPSRFTYFSPAGALPITYIISPEGKLVHTKVGKVDFAYLKKIVFPN